MAKKTLYQMLQVNAGAAPEVIKAAYEARIAALKDSHAPEVVAERALLRDALEVLSDPVRRKLYDEKMREEALRAMSSGGEELRSRPANFVKPDPARSPLALMSGLALLVAVAIGGSWVWLDHKRKVEAQRLEAERVAEESRRREEAAQMQRETVNWVKDRSDTVRESAEQRRQEYQRQVDNRRIEYDRQRAAQQEQAEQRRAQYEQQRAEMQRQREEQENIRRAQQQLERDRRHLQELERSRGMQIPPAQR